MFFDIVEELLGKFQKHIFVRIIQNFSLIAYFIFFRFYRSRKWKYDNPINLEEIKNDPNIFNFKLRVVIFFYLPNNRGDCIPIITPAFPSINSTNNFSLTTRNIIIKELEKAIKITKHLMS